MLEQHELQQKAEAKRDQVFFRNDQHIRDHVFFGNGQHITEHVFFRNDQHLIIISYK